MRLTATRPAGASNSLTWLMKSALETMRAGCRLQPQPLPDRGGEFRLIHGVKMQPRCAGLEQVFAQARDHIKAKSAYGVGVVAVTLELFADPARYLRAASIRKPRELRKAAN